MLVKKENQKVSLNITVNKHKLEQVNSFVYLGSVILDDGRCMKEINKRIAMAKYAFWSCKEFLRRDLSIKLKKRLLNCYVKSTLCYGGEAWTYNKSVCSKINSCQLWCYRRMLKIKYSSHTTNWEVQRRIGEESCWAEEFAKRKLRFAGHLIGDNTKILEKIALEGLIEGQRSRGRQRRIWGDDIKEWCKAKNFGEVKRKAENREIWRSMVSNLRFEDGT